MKIILVIMCQDRQILPKNQQEQHCTYEINGIYKSNKKRKMHLRSTIPASIYICMKLRQIKPLISPFKHEITR